MSHRQQQPRVIAGRDPAILLRPSPKVSSSGPTRRPRGHNAWPFNHPRPPTPVTPGLTPGSIRQPHHLLAALAEWMPGSSPGMTMREGERIGIKPLTWKLILDKRTKMFYVCSCLSPTPGAWLASRPVTGSQVWLSVRILYGRVRAGVRVCPSSGVRILRSGRAQKAMTLTVNWCRPACNGRSPACPSGEPFTC